MPISRSVITLSLLSIGSDDSGDFLDVNIVDRFGAKVERLRVPSVMKVQANVRTHAELSVEREDERD